MSDPVQAQHRAERFSHALYGLIIITAVLVAEQQHIVDATDALGLLVGTAVVLLLVHTYTEVMAVRLVEGQRLGGHGRRLVVLDNAPVLAGVVLPVVAFILAEAGVLTLSAAFSISIVFCLLTLAGLGFREGQVNGLGWSRSTISAAAAGGIGLLMVFVEAAFD